MKFVWIILSGFIVIGFNNCGQNDLEFNGDGNLRSIAGLESPNPSPAPPEGESPDEIPVEPSSCGQLPANKICICHVPDGNPVAKHTIIVGRSALRAHLDDDSEGTHEGDYEGPCTN